MASQSLCETLQGHCILNIVIVYNRLMSFSTLNLINAKIGRLFDRPSYEENIALKMIKIMSSFCMQSFINDNVVLLYFD